MTGKELAAKKQAIETALTEVKRVWELELSAMYHGVPRKFDAIGCAEESKYFIDELVKELEQC